MNGPVQLAGFAICLLSAILATIATFAPEWRRNDPKSEIIESVIRHQGKMFDSVSNIYI